MPCLLYSFGANTGSSRKSSEVERTGFLPLIASFGRHLTVEAIPPAMDSTSRNIPVCLEQRRKRLDCRYLPLPVFSLNDPRLKTLLLASSAMGVLYRQCAYVLIFKVPPRLGLHAIPTPLQRTVLVCQSPNRVRWGPVDVVSDQTTKHRILLALLHTYLAKSSESHSLNVIAINIAL